MALLHFPAVMQEASVMQFKTMGGRLWTGVGVILASLFGILLLGTVLANQLANEADRTQTEQRDKALLALQWTSLIDVNVTRILATTLSPDKALSDAFGAKIPATIQEISGVQKRLSELPLTDADQALMKQIAATRTDVLASLNKGRELQKNGDQAAALQEITSRFMPLVDKYMGELRQFVTLQDRQRAESLERLEDIRNRNSWILRALVVVLASLIILGAGLLIRSIRTELARAVQVAEGIAQGDLTQTAHSERADELGDMLRALDHMNLSLARMVGQVRNSSHAITSSSAEIASGNHDLSERTERAAADLQGSAQSLAALTRTLEHNAQSASTASQLAQEASTVAERGGQVVEGVVSTMDAINGSSRKIADIIGTIDGIAFQTNILALNAAVEAARAGEQGRGFAVVAGEVRTLAQRSAAAAKEIKELITASVNSVESGTQQVSQAGQTMNEIVAAVQRVSGTINEIAASLREQNAGLVAVNHTVAQLDQMTQQNAALVEQAAAAASSMKEQADSLSGVMANFKVSEGARAGQRPPALTIS
jgi:methyl-accepting chemotaxis protein